MTSSEQTPVVIFGAGGLAREVAWAASLFGARLVWPDDRPDTNVELVGHLDDRMAAHGTLVNDRPILGGAEWLADHPGHAVLVAVGKPAIRRQITERLSALGARFPALLSPDTIIGDEAVIGAGVITLPGVIITTNVVIGGFTLLNPHVSISHDCIIGQYCSLGPGVSLAGDVVIGEECDIGTHVSAIPATCVGRNTIVGAGACVVHNLPDNVTAVGVPARPVYRHKE